MINIQRFMNTLVKVMLVQGEIGTVETILFVFNVILNNVTQVLFQRHRCNYASNSSNKLFAKECFIDIYDNGFTNDNLPLLFKESGNAKLAVKVAS